MEGTDDAEQGAAHEAATGGAQPTPLTQREGVLKPRTVVRRETIGGTPRVPKAAWKTSVVTHGFLGRLGTAVARRANN